MRSSATSAVQQDLMEKFVKLKDLGILWQKALFLRLGSRANEQSRRSTPPQAAKEKLGRKFQASGGS
ncbi:hypothetical protein ACFX2F_039121 [Malus domestica]